MDERVVGLGLGIFWSLFLEESEKVLLSLTWRRASFQCARRAVCGRGQWWEKGEELLSKDLYRPGGRRSLVY